MAIQAIKRQNVSELVLEQMKEMINSGEWQPGTKIPSENELASLMGVSRVTIRSAIQKLSSLGLVESRHGEGTYVCTLDGSQCFNSMIPMIMLSNHDRESLHEFRTMIEVEGAMLAARRITAKQLEALRQTVTEMEQYKEEPAKAAAADMAFHKGIAEATGNPYIIQVFDILETTFTKYLVDNIHTMGASSGVYYHNAICDALETHDAALAKQRMADHLAVTHETMVRLLDDKEI